MATDEDLSFPGSLTADLLKKQPGLANTILGSTGGTLSPNTITFSADTYKQKRQENIENDDLQQSLYNFKQVGQTEVDGDFDFIEAKRVTIARAFYDHGVKNNQFAGGANIQSVADISSVVYPLIENLTSISDKKSEAYLRKDAYRAAFRDLFVGEDSLRSSLNFLSLKIRIPVSGFVALLT